MRRPQLTQSNEQARHQADVARLKETLDAAVFLEAWETGRECGLEAILEMLVKHLS